MKKTGWFVLPVCLLFLLLPLSGCRPHMEKQKIEVTAAMINPPQSLNPVQAGDPSTQEIVDILYRGLIDWNEEWKPFPVCAREVPTLENGGLVKKSKRSLKVNFLLNPVARWSNGPYIESTDFLFFYELARYPGNAGLNDEWMKIVDTIVTMGEERLEIGIRGLDPLSMTYIRPLPRMMLEAGVYRNPRAFFTEPVKFQNVVNGPFILGESTVKNEKILSLRLYPNSEYNGVKPGISGVLVRFFATLDAFESDLFAGNYDVFPSLTYEQGKKLARNMDYALYFTPGTSLDAVFFDTGSPVFAEKEVRKAFALAFDRAGLVKAVYEGDVPAARSWLSERHADFVPAFETLTFNQKMAFECLKKAGWQRQGEKGWSRKNMALAVKILYDDSREHQAAVRYVRENWERMGIQVQEEKVPAAKFRDRLLALIQAGTYPEVILASIDVPPWGQASSIFSSALIPVEKNGALGSNLSRWSSRENETLCRAIYEELGGDRRKKLIREQQELVAEEVPMVPLYFRPRVSAAKKHIQNFTPRGFGSTMWNIEKWRCENQKKGK